jgi:FkbM family methyltransferase
VRPVAHLDNASGDSTPGELDGVPVRSPSTWGELDLDAVLIGSMYGRDMAAQLRELGYEGPILDVSAAHLPRWAGHFGAGVQDASEGAIAAARSALFDDASRYALDGLLAYRRTLDPLSLPEPTPQYRDARAPVEEGDVVIDAGGFDGDTAVEYAERVGRTGHVHAFEPVAANVAALEERLAQHPLATRVTAWPLALWEREERLSVLTDEPHPMQYRVAPDPEGPFEGVRVDAWKQRNGVARIDWIKMDVEGAEHEVLQGATACLATDRPRLAVSMYHRPRDLWELPLAVASLLPGASLFLAHHSQNLYESVCYARPEARE